MSSLRNDGGNVGIRDHRLERALQLACGGALATMGAFAGVTLFRPGLVSLDAPASAPAFLVLGLTGLAAMGLVSTLTRMGRAQPQPPMPGEGVDGAEPDGQSAATSRDAGREPMRTGVTELAEAVAATGIARVLLLMPSGEKASGAVALARRLAGRGDPTILVDFDGGRTVGDLGLLQTVESVAHVAASPTTFAHSIHRDRSSRSHIMAAHLDARSVASDAPAAVASVLATLEEVYARVIAIVPATVESVASLVHENAALVVPDGMRGDAAVNAALDRLARQGASETIVLVEEKPERPKAAFPRAVNR